jgi:hypothetical protein
MLAVLWAPPGLSSALGMACKGGVVGISRFSQYRLVVVSGGASSVGVYGWLVSVPVCAGVHGHQGVRDHG